MQAGKRQQKNTPSQAAAASGRRAEVRQDSQQSLLSSGHSPLQKPQAKLSIGQPGDRHEQEADRVADHVASQPLQRTPSFAQQTVATSEHQRPPAITPVIQQQADEIPAEENQLQEEEQQVQGMGLQFQEEAAAETEDVQEVFQLQGNGEVLQSKAMSVGGRAARVPFSRPGRPTSRAPPPLLLKRRPRSSRAPPSMMQCTAGHPPQQSNISRPAQWRWTDNRSSSPKGPHQQTGEVRPGLVQCRAPPAEARTEGSESRLDHELRQSRGGGLPLPEKTRNQMESGIGADFNNVRVHTDASAEQMNRMLGSQAFATGNDIFFASGKYDPESLDGQRLLAHELTHTVQQNASPRIQQTPALGPRGPPVQHTSYNLQGGFIGDRLNEYARHVPGWELFTVIIGYNPLTEQDVSRTAQNFLRGFMGLVVGGTALYDKLNENGLIDDAFSWLSNQLGELDLSWARLRNAIDAAWEDMDFIRWDPFDYNLRVLKRHLLPVWNDVKTFAGRVIDKTVELVRTTMLTPLVNFIKERTRAYPLLSVILGSDPITGEQVDRSLYNIVSAFLMLTESGEEYLNKLNESGKLQELSDWLDGEIERLDVSVETVTNAFTEGWELLDLNAVLHPIDTFTRLYNIFSGPVLRLFNFVINVALKVLGLIKDWLLGLLKEYANRIPGYPLLRVILGQDPLTGEEVPRTAENFIRGFLSFVPGGLEKFNNLKESGAIDRAFAWLEETITSLGLIGEAFANAFRQIWETFSINDLSDPIGAFERVVAIFTEPVSMLIDFAIEVGMKVLEFIFEGVLGPTGARVLAIMKKARSTFLMIIRDPIGFVGHLIEALAKGFSQFSSNILTHLRNGLIAWLTGTLSGAGIQLPERFDFKGIVSLVLQILGLTWPRIREKLVRRLGERTVAILETSFDIIRLLITEGPGALWEKLMEHVSNLKDTVMEGIRNFIITRIVTAAVTKLATMWNPVGAVIQAILGIYNTVMFFIERINQILALVESVVNSVSKIASGAIQDAADFVEQAMGRTIPVILGFLARLIGLGNISSAIQNIIRRVQATVDRGLDRVLDWIVSQGRRLLNRLRGRGDPTAQQAVDPANMTPDQKKAAAKQEFEQWLRGGRRSGTQISAQLPRLKDKYRLRDAKVEFSGAGPRVAFAASPAVFTYFDPTSGENVTTHDAHNTPGGGPAGTSQRQYTGVVSMAGAPTPFALISNAYSTTRNSEFRCRQASVDRPQSVTAEKVGPTTSAGRGSASSPQQWALGLGIDEQKILTDDNPVTFNGGHLVSYEIMGADSDRSHNLAPQAQRFNSPAYYNVIERAAGESLPAGQRVRMSVDLGYRQTSYTVSQDTLFNRGLLSGLDPNGPETISIPVRIPHRWNAVLEAIGPPRQLGEGGASSGTQTVTTGRVVVNDRQAFNQMVLDNTAGSTSEGGYNHFKMLIRRGAEQDASSGAIRTGGAAAAGRQHRITITAQQTTPSYSQPPPVPQRSRQPRPSSSRTHTGRGPVEQRSRIRHQTPRRGGRRKIDPMLIQSNMDSANEGGLLVGKPGDRYEQEADRVADHVVGGEPTHVQSMPCVTEMQRSSDTNGQTTRIVAPNQSGGEPLASNTHSEMEGRIGADFSAVRVHTDESAVQMSTGIAAKAFTHGNHVYFNQRQYAPQTSAGKHLLAHELTHVVQQDSSIRRQPVEVPWAASESAAAETVAAETAATKKKENGPLVLGGAPMPGLESPVEGQIKSSSQAEQQAEANVGATKNKKEQDSKTKGEGKGGKGKKKPAGEKQPAKEKETEEKVVGKEKTTAEPEKLKGSSSDGMLEDFMSSTASQLGASYPTLGAGVSESLKVEKKQESETAPHLSARTGKGKVEARAPPVEEGGTREAAIEEKEPQQSAQQKMPEHKTFGKPVSNSKNNKALDQAPAGSWISWFKNRVTSFMSTIHTRDDGVNTRAGKPPKTEMKGDADPKRADKQRSDGDKQTGAEKDRVKSQVKGNPGKERIQPAPVDATNEVKIEAAVPEVETGNQDDMADYVNMPLPEGVRKRADQGMAPLLEKSLAKPQGDVKKATVKRNTGKQHEVSKAKAEVKAENEKAEQEQQNIVRSSRSDVAVEQKKGLDEADQQIKKYRKEADKEQTSLRGSVKKRIKEDEGKAAVKLKKAEEDAKKEKKKREAEAAAKKRELKKKQKKKSWWDRVKDAVKSVVKAITKAIDGIFNALRKAVKFIIDTAKNAALAIIELGRKFVVGLLDSFRKLLKGLVSNLIGKVFPELARKINKTIDKVVDTAIKGVNKVAKALKKGVEALANKLGKILDKILSVFQTALKAAVQIVGAVLTGDFAEAAKIAFYAACDILGINPKSVISFMEKAGESLGKIFKSPSTFFNNVAKGVKKGINQFVAKIKQHLVSGLIKWLTGAMGDVKITLPKKFDLKGIFSLVTQILGLTYDNIRAKVVKKLGPKGETIVSTLEKTFVFLKELVTKGPVAIWDRVKKNLSNLKEKVIEGIRNVVIEKVVKAGVVWLISMLNPASALVKAIKMLYDLVMFFVERWEQIVDFAKSIWNSVAALANGQIGAAANAVEQALARSIPVILGLLASLLGLGGIGKSVQKVIKKIRKPIDMALDKVIGWIVKQAKRLIKSGKAGVAKIVSWWKKSSRYTDIAGKSHKVYFSGQGKGAKLTRASSTPVVFDSYVKKLEAYINADQARKSKYGSKITVVKNLQKMISDTQYRINSQGKTTSNHFSEKEGRELQKNLDSLTKELKSLPSPNTEVVARPKSIIRPGTLHSTKPTPNMAAKGYNSADKMKEGTGVVADPLTMTASQPGSKAGYYSNLYGYLKNELNLHMVAGHILYHRLHGSGVDSENIAPISGSDNRKMESRFETKAFNAVFKENAVLHYGVTFGYGGSSTKETGLLPTSVTADIYKKKFKGKETPADRANPAKYTGRDKDIYNSGWSLEIPSVSAGLTVAEKMKALRAGIVTELSKNPKLTMWGATPATGFTRIPYVRNNFDGLSRPDKAKIEARFDLEKTKKKNADKAVLKNGFSNSTFLASISSFLKATVLSMAEVAAEIRNFSGTTTSKSTVERWRRNGMPSVTQDDILGR